MAVPDPRTTEFLNLITLLLLVVVILSGWIIVTRQEGEVPRPRPPTEKGKSREADEKKPEGRGPK